MLANAKPLRRERNPSLESLNWHKTSRIGFVDGRLKIVALVHIFAAHINVARVGLHGERRDQTTFDEKMRIMTHHLAVFACPRL